MDLTVTCQRKVKDLFFVDGPMDTFWFQDAKNVG